MLNQDKLEYCNVPAWHKAGYTGRWVKVAHLEGSFNTKLSFFDGKIVDPFGRHQDKVQNLHQVATADILHQVAPEALIYALPSGYPAKPGMIESMEFCISEGIPLATMSLGGSVIPDKTAKEMAAYEAGTLLCKSAGNTGDRGLNPCTQQDHWWSVGACTLDSKGKLVRTSYSSVGEELDVMSFGNVYVHDARDPNRAMYLTGTSFACPFFVGLMALYYQWHTETYGRYPTIAEAKEFVLDNCMDLEQPGHDPNTGHGLFVLPDPASLPELRKEDKSAVNKPEYIVIHHSATAQGDAASFRRYHLSLGWLDIGYHYVINNGTYQPDGLVETGRSEDREGAHCTEQAMNRRSIGVCLVGDFDQDKPTEKQMESLIKLCRELMAKYNIPVERVIGHREAGAPKTCPGKNFDMEELRMILKTSETKFEDVPQNHWAKTDIEAVAAAGIMSGYPDGRFGPDEPVTRAQLAAVVNRLRRGYYGERS